jgi:hypothetical protein
MIQSLSRCSSAAYSVQPIVRDNCQPGSVSVADTTANLQTTAAVIWRLTRPDLLLPANCPAVPPGCTTTTERSRVS